MVGDDCRVAVLGSGRGSNFEALADAAGPGWRIVAVGSDKPRAPLLARARQRGLPVFCREPGDFAGREAHDAALSAALARHAPDLVLLAGYMRVLGPAMIQPWAGRMLNIHPSLLPAWPGLRTHENVLRAGDREHGATVHFVTAELDSGPRVIQGRLAVAPGETVSALADRVHRLEHYIYPTAVGWYASSRLKLERDMALLDGKALVEPVVIEESACA